VPQEIRFCPADVARTYPLDSRGRVQSLLMPHVAVINYSATPFTVNAIHLELIEGGQVLDVRHLNAADVQRFASNSSEIQPSGKWMQAERKLVVGSQSDLRPLLEKSCAATY
jgi:hypothetical protein